MTEQEERERYRYLQLKAKAASAAPQQITPDPVSTTSPLEAAGTAVKDLFMPRNPGNALLEYSPLPTQSKANTGLAMANALSFGGAEKAIRAISPTTPEPSNKEKIVGESMAAVLPVEGAIKAGVGAAKTAGNVLKVATKETPYIKEITQLIRKPFVEAGEKLGKTIDAIDMTANGDRKLSLTDTVINIMQESENNPAIRSAINRSPTLKKVMETPGLSDNITARMSQDIVNELKGTVSMQNKMAGSVKAMPIDRDVMDIIGQIRKEQLQAFPELKEAFKDYGKVATNYWRVKNLANVDKATGFMRGQSSGFGNAPIRDAVKELSPEAYSKVKDYRITKAIPGAVGIGAAGAATAEVIRRLFGR